MTRKGAEAALSELEIYAFNRGREKIMVQGRWLSAVHKGESTYAYGYAGELVTREAALTVLQNR